MLGGGGGGVRRHMFSQEKFDNVVQLGVFLVYILITFCLKKFPSKLTYFYVKHIYYIATRLLWST